MMFNISNDFDTLLSQRDQEKATYDNCLSDQGPLNTETFTAKRELAEIYYSLGQAYCQTGNYREATRHYWMAVELTVHERASSILYMNPPDSCAITTLPVELDNENAWQTQEIPKQDETLFLNGLQYLSGLGVQKNFVKAQDFFEMAALQNNMYAQNHLGFMYKRGKVEGFRKGSLQANTEALRWFQRAADQGLANAQNNLGWMYHMGKVEGFPEGSLQANAAAVQWYQRAADQGFAPAQNILGMMYCDGEVEGFPENSPQANAAAADWFQRAADQGIMKSHFTVNRLYAWLLKTYALSPDIKQVNNLLEKKRIAIEQVVEAYRESSLLNTTENLKRLLAFTDNEDLRENLVAQFKQLNTLGDYSFTDNLSLILNNAKLANQFIKRHDLYSYPLQDVKQLAGLLSEMIPYFFKLNIPVEIIDICMSFLFSLPVAKTSTLLQQESEILPEQSAWKMGNHTLFLRRAVLFSSSQATDLFITKAELTECLNKSWRLFNSKPKNLRELLQQESHDISYKAICAALKEDGLTTSRIVDALKEKFDAKLVATASALKT